MDWSVCKLQASNLVLIEICPSRIAKSKWTSKVRQQFRYLTQNQNTLNTRWTGHKSFYSQTLEEIVLKFLFSSLNLDVLHIENRNMMKLLLVFMMVYTSLAELPSMTLMNELLHFCLQNGHKSIIFSNENPDSLIKISKIFFQYFQTRILVPNQLINQGIPTIRFSDIISF